MKLAECFFLSSQQHLLHMQENLDSATISTLQCFVVLMYHTKLVTLWKSMRPEKKKLRKSPTNISNTGAAH